MKKKVRNVIAIFAFCFILLLLLLILRRFSVPKGDPLNILEEDYYDWFGYSNKSFQFDDRRFQSVDSSLFDQVDFERLTERKPIIIYFKDGVLHKSKLKDSYKYYFYEAPNDSDYSLLIPAEGVVTFVEPLRPLAYVLRDISAESQENGEPIQSH